MVYGIIGALDEEIALVKEKMTGIEEHRLYGRSFYTGRIGQKDVVLVCCGVGKVNAALFANAVIREFKADAVINIGIAGAIGAGIGIGKIGASAMEAIARQPEAAGDIRSNMIVIAALIEGVALFAVIVCVLALFV